MRLKWYQVIIPLLLFLILLQTPVDAQDDSPLPDQIEVDMEPRYGFLGLPASYHGTFTNDGYSVVMDNRARLGARLIYINQVDLGKYFDDINFSDATDWTVQTNDSLDIDDDPEYTLQVEMIIGNSQVSIDYMGYSSVSSMICNVDDACEFVASVFDLIFEFDQRPLITVPNPLSFYGIAFVITAIALPIFMSRSLMRERSSIINVLESTALFVDFYLLFAIFAYLFSDLDLFLHIVAFASSLVLELWVFRWYYNKIWGSEIPDEGPETSEEGP